MFENMKNKTIYQSVFNTATTYPKRKAFFYQGKYYTYEHLLKRINSFSEELLNLGYKKDDVITFCLPNIPEALYLFYATNQIGGIANLIHPLMKFEQLKEILIKVKSNILFVLDTRYNEFKALEQEGIKVYPVSPVYETNFILKFGYRHLNAKDLSFYNDSSSYAHLDKFYNNKGVDEFDLDINKDAIYLHSGGTTGSPKTIALSSSALNCLITNAYDVLDFNDGEVTYILSVLPMFHGFGLAICCHIELCFGGCDMLMPKFNTKGTIKMLKKGKLNYIAGVPTLYEALLRNKKFSGKKLKNLKNCFVGGDFVNQSLVDRFNKRMEEAGASVRLYVGYGLTETVTVCAVNTTKNHKDGTVGKPLYNVKVDVIDENLNILNRNEEGELIIAGETLMNGYRFGNEEDNKNVFLTINNTKYIRTGDYGFVDDEGYIHFKQRIKRLIKVAGINIFPSEVENVVSSLPFVFECAAIGVEDQKLGNMIKLFVVLDRSFKKDYAEYNKQINELIVNKCSVYAKPKEIVYIDSLPKTLIGKVDTKLLK